MGHLVHVWVMSRCVLLNGPFWLLLGYTSYYVALEPVAGVTWGLLQALPTWILATLFEQRVPLAWLWALGLHALSWWVQVRRLS